MRVLAMTNLYPSPILPYRAPFNRQEFSALAGQHTVRVIAPIAWTDERRARRQGAARLVGVRRVVRDGITVDHPRYIFPPRVLRAWYGHFFRWSVRTAFERALAEFRPDLVYSPWAYPDGWAAVDLGQKAGLPVVVKVHGSDVLLLPRHPDRRRRTVEALRRADAVITVSRDLAERVVGLGVDPDRVHLIYGGVDHGLFHPGPACEARRRLDLPADEPILLFVGNLVHVKGPDLLVAACGRLARDGVRFTAYLIGQGPAAASLGRQIDELGLTGRVRLLGPKPHDELPDWYRAADLFVLPSRSEGVPGVLKEAQACGTPFVASRVGGVPEVLILGVSRLVPPENPGALSGAIRAVIEGTSPRPADFATRTYADVAVDVSALFEQTFRRPRRPHREPPEARR